MRRWRARRGLAMKAGEVRVMEKEVPQPEEMS